MMDWARLVSKLLKNDGNSVLLHDGLDPEHFYEAKAPAGPSVQVTGRRKNSLAGSGPLPCAGSLRPGERPPPPTSSLPAAGRARKPEPRAPSPHLSGPGLRQEDDMPRAAQPGAVGLRLRPLRRRATCFVFISDACKTLSVKNQQTLSWVFRLRLLQDLNDRRNLRSTLAVSSRGSNPGLQGRGKGALGKGGADGARPGLPQVNGTGKGLARRDTAERGTACRKE